MHRCMAGCICGAHTLTRLRFGGKGEIEQDPLKTKQASYLEASTFTRFRIFKRSCTRMNGRNQHCRSRSMNCKISRRL